MVQADVRMFAANRDPQRDGAAVRVPDRAARRLGGEHGNAVGAEQAHLGQPS